jgi:hypothetical protein
MKQLPAVLLALLAAWPALASPQGTWPEEMRGYSLPKQNWIMILPATRRLDGTVSVWNRADVWNRQWIVPKATPNGTRTVAVNGDSEDQRIVSPEQIDNMSVTALSRLASKYGASAIAVVVAEEHGEVAVAAWAKGNYATWETAVDNGTPRTDALRTIDEIYSGSNRTPGGETARETAKEQVSIIGQRFNEQAGRLEYRIAGPISVLDEIAAHPSFEVAPGNGNVPPSIDLMVKDGRDVEQALSEAGFEVR